MRIIFNFINIIMCFFLFSTIGFAHSIEDQIVIHMNEQGFGPKNIEIKQGDIVIFENEGEEDHWPASNIHPTHEIYLELDPKKPIKPGEVWSFTFTRTGAWTLHDHLYPQFTGNIIVVKDKEGGSVFAQETVNPEKKNFISFLFERIKNFFAEILNQSSTNKQARGKCFIKIISSCHHYSVSYTMIAIKFEF